jgi:hypothetical protein
LSRNVRIDCARENNQSLSQLGAGEVLGFRFCLEGAGQARASPFRQDATLMYFKGHIPDRRHLPSTVHIVCHSEVRRLSCLALAAEFLRALLHASFDLELSLFTKLHAGVRLTTSNAVMVPARFIGVPGLTASRAAARATGRGLRITPGRATQLGG